AGIRRATLAQHIVKSVGNLRFEREFTGGGNAAVAHPAVLSVGAGAVKDDVCFFGAFTRLFAYQQTKGLLGALTVTERVLLQEAVATDLEHVRFGSNYVAQLWGLCQRLKIDGDVAPPRDRFGVRRKLVTWIGLGNRSPAKRRCVHSEWAEEAYVPPALHVLADPAALENGDRQIEPPRVESRLQADGTGA